MPAIMDDPDSATVYRVSGDPPYPDPGRPSLPPSIVPRRVTLRDRQTVATVVPFASRLQVPESLLRYLNDQFNKEIEGGDTYPMMEGMSLDKFSSYWFQNFAAIMLLGDITSPDEVVEGKDWSKECLGTFYIKPNYPGRSSHVCNAGFIVTDASRNRGVGRLMGESYLDWAPKLGYIYSVFNLVYETNVASCKIWDALGFKRIGRVKGCGSLKSYPDRLIDAIIYGRDLGDAGGSGSEELVSEERFDKIKFYLKYGRYPNGADRAEKSRLRSAATHYKLLDGDVLMLRDKEVISDPQRQLDMARDVHNQTHAGINKTTATIAERYHWSRIKETVSDVIRTCYECKELGKTTAQSSPMPGGGNALMNQQLRARSVHGNPAASPAPAPSPNRLSPSPSASGPGDRVVTAAESRSMSLPESAPLPGFAMAPHRYVDASEMPVITTSDTLQTNVDTVVTDHHDGLSRRNPMLQDHPHSALLQQHTTSTLTPLGPHHTTSVYQPIDPQIIDHYSFHNHVHQTSHSHNDHGPDEDTFQALLDATDVDVDSGLHHTQDTHDTLQHLHHLHHVIAMAHDRAHDVENEVDRAAVDRDLEMLIQQPQEDEDEEDEKRRPIGMDVDIGVDDANDIAITDAVCVVLKGRSAATKMDLAHLLSCHEDTNMDDEQGDIGASGRRMDPGGFGGPRSTA